MRIPGVERIRIPKATGNLYRIPKVVSIISIEEEPLEDIQIGYCEVKRGERYHECEQHRYYLEWL